MQMIFELLFCIDATAVKFDISELIPKCLNMMPLLRTSGSRASTPLTVHAKRWLPSVVQLKFASSPKYTVTDSGDSTNCAVATFMLQAQVVSKTIIVETGRELDPYMVASNQTTS